ncbi:hypothetical protein Ava_2454 [Trichormus variabilis ATCC 29413]|uniref:Uncharacterized protein n=2 Tax=Anabaena variabilis TaxID=264691 RepID=Q3MAB7_TRIV2|nr:MULTISPECIES: hypothetical protein [Nostocaceae]ABA22069.1 hypothetical protein Ava_2454 [Trichormus variabilis ATCC 29413]MBC1256815.1 hypothetical protein [Trichormus variabilis V5]MBC1270487.1 hypothetical protein [Trichormus variabilis FSR]MBC1305186.1 hypothetical protein [Trichormus variabilis N2B]MBC1314311.1 hypothetical protein [Trichormus variabilis PNB]
MKRKFSCISVSALLVTGILSASIVAPAYAKAGGQGQGQTSGGQGQGQTSGGQGQGQTSGGQGQGQTSGGQGQGQTSGGQGQTSSGQGQTSGGQTSSAICSICTLKNYLSVLKN